MMNYFVERAAAAATWALVALPIVALAGAAHAQDVRIAYGDLSNPAQAAAFEHRVDAAAKKICADFANDGLARQAACLDAVRAEALAQLSPAQRVQAAMVRTASPSAS